MISTADDIAGRLRAEPLVQRFTEALMNTGVQAWIVGGAVRDAALGVETADYDLAVQGDPAIAAKAAAAAL